MPTTPTNTEWDYLYLPCFPNTLGGVSFWVYFTNVANTGNVTFTADRLAGGVDTVSCIGGTNQVVSNAPIDFASFGVLIGDWIEILAGANAGIFQITAITTTVGPNDTLTLDIDTDHVFYPVVPPPPPFAADPPPGSNYRINPFDMIIDHDGTPAAISEFLVTLGAGLDPRSTWDTVCRVEKAPVRLVSRDDAVNNDKPYLAIRAELHPGAGISLSHAAFATETQGYYSALPDTGGLIVETTDETQWSRLRLGSETAQAAPALFNEAVAYWENHEREWSKNFFVPFLYYIGAGRRGRISAHGALDNPCRIVIDSFKAKQFVDVYNRQPQIVVPPNYAIVTGRYGKFDASKSTDADGGKYLAKWHLIEAPDDSKHTISLRNAFTTDDLDGDPYTYILEHVDFGVDPDIVAGQTLIYNNKAYIINSVGVGTADLGLLDYSPLSPLYFYLTSLGVFPDADELPITTTDISVKIYKQDFLPSNGELIVSLEMDVAGTFSAAGVVYDMEKFSEMKEVVVMARDSETLLGEAVNGEFIWKYLSDGWSEFTEREYFTEYFSGLLQITGNQLLKLWQTEKSESLQDIQPYFLYRWLDMDNRVYDEKPDDQTWTSGLGLVVFTPVPGAHTGETIEIDVISGDPDNFATQTLTVTTVTNATDAINDLISQLNALGYSFSATFATFSGSVWYAITSSTPFTITGGTAIAGGLFSGTASERTNFLWGTGYPLTNRVYYVSRSLWGFEPDGHFLVVAGEEYEILRILDDRSIVSEPYALVVVNRDFSDAAYAVQSWCIPGYFTSDETSWYEELVHNGDDAVISTIRGTTFDNQTLSVAGVLGKKIGLFYDISAVNPDFAMDNSYWDSFSLDYAIRSNYLKVDEKVHSVPRLQAKIDQPSTYLTENNDYIVTTFRDTNAINYGFQTPPDYVAASHAIVENSIKANVSAQFWAEHTYTDYRQHISNSFGYSVGFEEEDYEQMKVLEYLSGVRGLWFIFGRGRTLENLSTGLNIFCSLPTNDVPGTISSIKDSESLDNIRIEIEDADGNKKVYLVSRELGVANNPSTGASWAIGDTVPRFSTLSAGVETDDWLSDPKWFRQLQDNTSTTLYDRKFWEIQKYHTFKAGIPAKDYSADFIKKIYDFILSYRPMHLFLGDEGFYAWKRFKDDIEVVEEINEIAITMHIKHGLCGTCTLIYDGTCKYDLSSAIYDSGSLSICPDEVVEADISYTFTGTPKYDTIIAYDDAHSPPLPVGLQYDMGIAPIPPLTGAFIVTIIIHA